MTTVRVREIRHWKLYELDRHELRTGIFWRTTRILDLDAIFLSLLARADCVSVKVVSYVMSIEAYI